MPAGDETTLPAPVPALSTVIGKLGTAKRAMMLRAAVIVTTQVGVVPVQSPSQR